jgi:putative pyruvate formate lyase activating enzyme
MHRQVGDLVLDANGLAKHGIILRHLVMLGQTVEAGEIMKFVAREFSKDTYCT